MRVINGKQKGGPLEDIHNFDVSMIKDIGRNDVILDNTTGDYY